MKRRSSSDRKGESGLYAYPEVSFKSSLCVSAPLPRFAFKKFYRILFNLNLQDHSSKTCEEDFNVKGSKALYCRITLVMQ
jgi:hypothetical protein